MLILCKDVLREIFKLRLVLKILKIMYLVEILLFDKLKYDFFEVGMNGGYEVNE